MKAYKVFLGSREIDKVFWVDNSTRAEVKESLIQHDGYNPRIRVVEERKRPVGRKAE